MSDALAGRRTVVLLPAANPGRVRTPLRLLGITGHLLPLGGVSALVLAADVPQEQLHLLSKAFRRADLPVIAVTDGQLQVRTARRGTLSEPVSAGLAAQSWPDQVLGLVFGSLDPAQVPGALALTGTGGDEERPGLLGRLFGRRNPAPDQTSTQHPDTQPTDPEAGR